MSSLIGYHLAQSQSRVRVKTRTPINIKVVSYQYRNTHYIKRWSRSHRWLSAVTPLLKHWSYCSLRLSHPCNLYNGNSCSWRHFKTEKSSRFRGSPEYFFPCGVVTVLAIHPNCILNSNLMDSHFAYKSFICYLISDTDMLCVKISKWSGKCNDCYCMNEILLDWSFR